jgi:hypothetical protein
MKRRDLISQIREGRVSELKNWYTPTSQLNLHSTNAYTASLSTKKEKHQE